MRGPISFAKSPQPTLVCKKRDNQAVTACFLPWGSNYSKNCLKPSEVYANRAVYKFARV